MSIRRRSSLPVAALLLAAGVAQAAPPAAPPPPAAQEEPLEKYRERFKAGMDRYKAGALAEAIGYWEAIFRELGDQKGYRLAYNLGVAYAELGDATRAFERLQAFVAQVDARRSRGDALAVIVQKEDNDARARIAGLAATTGRIRVEADPPRAVQIDAGEARVSGFVAWLAPGEHTVVFAPGTPDTQAKRVVVRVGETVDVAPTVQAPVLAPGSPASVSYRTSPSSGALLPVPLLIRREREHPFSPALVVISGGLSLAAALVAVPLEGHAWDLRNRFASEQQLGMLTDSDRQNFSNARGWAYAAVGTAVGLSALAAGLAAWYFFGSSQREVVVTPAGIGERF